MLYTAPMTRFAKYEGLGNDFVVVDLPSEGTDGRRRTLRAQAVALCDRHRGVGADGVLLVTPGLRPHMEVVNADGSHAQMCGNGLRCVALHLHRSGAMAAAAFVVDTDAGPHLCEVLGPEQVRVAMAPASLEPACLPLRSKAPWIDHPLQLPSGTLHLTAVSMGNPHAVSFDPVEGGRLQLGPEVAASGYFPAGVNVGFAHFSDRQAMELHVLERGAGWTEACGTGACAAAAAAVVTGRAERGRPLIVHLPGGPLTVVVGAEGEPIAMSGPTRHVFDGVTPE